MEPNGAYGGLKNGQWTGMIRELRTQMADLAVIDMSITSIRQTAVDFTMPYMNTGQQKSGMSFDFNLTTFRCRHPVQEEAPSSSEPVLVPDAALS